MKILFVYIVIWIVSGGVIFLGWNYFKAKTSGWRFLHFVTAITLLFSWLGLVFWQSVGERIYWDVRTRKLCEREGGGTIFEQVDPLPHMEDSSGSIFLPMESDAVNADPYFLKKSQRTCKFHDPKIIRTSYKIIRRKDGKTLGEWICYHCSGGLPGPWQRPAYTCPGPSTKDGLVQAVFSKGKDPSRLLIFSQLKK